MMNIKVEEVNHIVEEGSILRGTSIFIKEEFILEQCLPEIKEELHVLEEPEPLIKEELHVSEELQIDKVIYVILSVALTSKNMMVSHLILKNVGEKKLCLLHGMI